MKSYVETTLSFEAFPYTRPDMASFRNEFEASLELFAKAGSGKEQLKLLEELEYKRSHFLSMRSLASVRHTMDTADPFYEAENNFFDEHMPHFQALDHKFYRSLVESAFREKLEGRWGNQLFRLAEMTLRTFRPEIVEDLQEENRLSSAYTRLKAGARIQFRGEEYNLSSIRKLEESSDREIRREAARAKWGFFRENAARLDDLFDQLVQVRHRIAQKLGFENFIPLAYMRMGRSDYDAAQVKRFRAAIARHVVPLASELYARQRVRLGLDKLKYFDEGFRFASGNPEPEGDPAWIIQQARRMYRELSKETKVFFEYMMSHKLMDLETRPGKATGGYCTFLSQYRAPFIFSNFNGTSGDVDVLTHEAGHAFQIFSSRNLGIQEYYWPTLEACEIHSMSMEFFTWPWMDLFFGKNAEKHRFSHLAGALKFMPYGVAVDAFQHFVYENPEATPEARNLAWKRLEKEFLPHRDNDGLDLLEGGRFWQRQSHIYASPFYYIDYVLAQICALQFWQRDLADHEEAWEDYLHLCKAGGSRSFLELVKLAGLQSPFEEEAVQRVVKEAGEYLENVDDQSF